MWECKGWEEQCFQAYLQRKMYVTTLGVLKSNLCSHLDNVTGVTVILSA